MTTRLFFSRFFLNATPPTAIYTLSLHDALPISDPLGGHRQRGEQRQRLQAAGRAGVRPGAHREAVGQEDRVEQAALGRDRKSTRLNSSHMSISYAVFCLKKKKKRQDVVCR